MGHKYNPTKTWSTAQIFRMGKESINQRGSLETHGNFRRPAMQGSFQVAQAVERTTISCTLYKSCERVKEKGCCKKVIYKIQFAKKPK